MRNKEILLALLIVWLVLLVYKIAYPVTATPALYTLTTTPCEQTQCEAGYNLGQTFTMTATPVAGSTFVGWLSNFGCTGTTVCKYTITTSTPKDMRLIAVFNPISKEYLHVYVYGKVGVVTSVPAGIECASDGVTGKYCYAQFPRNSKVVLKATPVTGASFTWYVSGCSGIGTCTVTMTTAKHGNVKFK
jgi:hypothetical protein